MFCPLQPCSILIDIIANTSGSQSGRHRSEWAWSLVKRGDNEFRKTWGELGGLGISSSLRFMFNLFLKKIKKYNETYYKWHIFTKIPSRYHSKSHFVHCKIVGFLQWFFSSSFSYKNLVINSNPWVIVFSTAAWLTSTIMVNSIILCHILIFALFYKINNTVTFDFAAALWYDLNIWWSYIIIIKTSESW